MVGPRRSRSNASRAPSGARARRIPLITLAFALHCSTEIPPGRGDTTLAPEGPGTASSGSSVPPASSSSNQTPTAPTGSSGQPSSPGEDASAPASAGPSAADSGTAASTPPGAPSPLPTTFTKRLLDLTTYPDAVCNDGTAAAYYAEAGTSTSAPWVILLEGGSWCSSDAECEGRATSLSSSNGLAATETPIGILSNSATDNPHFAGANRIDVPYCTSDVFSGTAGPTGGKTNFSFQGRAVFEGIIADLKARYGLGASGQSVLLAGVSAGGVSVLINADHLATDLPDAKVFALVDAGFLPDVAPLVGPSILSQFQTALPYWKGSPDASCVAKNTTDPARCYLGQYVQPELATPVFFGQSLEDPHGPLHAGGFTLTSTPTAAQKNWVNQVYTPAMEQLLGAMGPAVGDFSPCQVIHTMADNSAWTSLTVNGDHYDDVVFAWFGGGSGERELMEPCTLP